MKPEELLKIASAKPGKHGLDDYRSTIVMLRDKSYSWRDIAEFLKENGIEKDGSTIYRYMMSCCPLFDHGDCPLEIGDLWYEAQGGRPLRPFGPGMSIAIKDRLRPILLEHPEGKTSTWCEYQFQLNHPPNRAWLKQLHESLMANFVPDRPFHAISRLGFELKFEGTVMALDCHIFNLKTEFETVRAGIVKTNQFFLEDKSRWQEMWKKREIREKKILEQYNMEGISDDDMLQEHAKAYAERLKKVADDFNALELATV